jgi:PAS domain S-box-containing protein
LNNRITKIYKLIFEISKGNYDFRGTISDAKDEYDAIITGINMLAEELQHTTISRNYLKSIYDGISEMVLIIDSNGHIEDINSTTAEYLGHKNLIDKPFNVIFSPSQQICFTTLVSKLKETTIVTNVEKSLKIKDKKTIHVSCSFSLIKDKCQKEFRILMLIKDISHLKHTEEMLLKRNQELNTFVYRASHDLKGPLASMLGLMNLIELEEMDLDSLKNYINLIKQSTIGLNKVVSDLLDLGRITIQDIQKEGIYIDKILYSVLDDIKYLPDRDQLSLTIVNKQSIPFHSEPRILKSILYNILENSIKYRKPKNKSNVTIEIDNTPAELKIVIEDDGMGIEEDIRDKVFNMFFRGNGDSDGSGLGLYIVKTGIEKLNGKIELLSELNVGSKFIITLPN